MNTRECKTLVMLSCSLISIVPTHRFICLYPFVNRESSHVETKEYIEALAEKEFKLDAPTGMLRYEQFRLSFFQLADRSVCFYRLAVLRDKYC